MPIYEYGCKSCKKKFELLRKFSDPTEVICPKCGSKDVEKKVGSFHTLETPGQSKFPKGKAPWEMS
jgi:putative FmdB family regulatory protein